ncbi:MAG: AMP-binding protein [Sulfurovum sp.]|nr:AMP-binding protein [Sulfurovum sp.]
MYENFTHFGELYKHLESTDTKENFLIDKTEEGWKTYSKAEFLRSVHYLTLAAHDNGWQGENVAIAIAPSAQWMMLDYALMLCGAVSVPLFTNISSKNLLFQCLDANIHTAFIETKTHEKCIANVAESIELIYLDDVSGYRSIEDLLIEGEAIDKANPTLFTELLERIKAEDLATIVYTSGTSGTPKGVELSHANLISQIHATSQNYHFYKQSDVAFSFLPLAHIFERMVMHFYLSQELTVYFADDVQNVGVLLKEVNPTVMTVVPRLLEKVFFKMKLKALEGSFVKKALVNLAFHRALTKDPEGRKNILDKFLDKLVYTKLRMALGTKMRMMISGGAPLADALYSFYVNIGLNLYQGYGLTESSPVIAANTPEHYKLGTCGKAFPGVRVKVKDDGELLVKGTNIMLGYHNNVKATEENIDKDGWLSTGDLASIDDEGYITITGRKKELLKTSTGEYVSAVYIEQKLTSNGWFEFALVIGEEKPYVSALLFIEHVFLGRLATQMNTTPLKALESQQFKEMTEKFIAKLNKKLNHWEKVRAYEIIADELTIENGELTPSMKLAKNHLMEKYDEEIKRLYKDHL